jgi:predicted kinase
VNRDDIRMALFGKPHGVDEPLVTSVQKSTVKIALLKGRDVVVDDTNLVARFAKEWIKLAAECRAEVEWHDEFLDVDVRTCIDRDRAREASVGADVIHRMYQRSFPGGKKPKLPKLEAEETPYVAEPYVADETLPEAILIDLDGTIAKNNGHRGFFEWSKVGADDPIKEVIRIVAWADSAGVQPLFASGREDVCYLETHDWIREHVPIENFPTILHMRAEGDGRKDSIIKLEIFDREFRNNYNVLFCLDDRNQVVEAYRSIGLRVLQVAPGDF